MVSVGLLLAGLLAQMPAPLIVAPERRAGDPTGEGRTLPARVTVCVGQTGGGCRLVAGDGQCAEGEKVFRTVLAPDAETALRDCNALRPADPGLVP